MANDPILFSPHSWADANPREGLVLQADTLIGGKYRLLRPAGFGGMGAVWVARNEATNAEVALKVLLAVRENADEGEAVARFRREAHAAAQLYHRGIVRVFDLIELTGDDQGTLVMVMELLRGETLANLVDKRRQFTLDETLSIMLPLLSALAHAHAAGIVHRDLKPENVFLSVDPDGHIIPKILDFGISKLTAPAAPKITTDGAMLGTPNYMSPEQARGSADVDARSDVFAAGILLYEMLAGQSPFANGSYHSVVAAILERDPPPLTNVPPEIWKVIKRALDKVSAIRFADASELANALRDAAVRAGGRVDEAATASYAAAAAPSIADRSVPPAPDRDPEVTLPSLRVKSKRRTRMSVVIGFALGSFLLILAAIVARVTRARTEPQAIASSPPAVETALPSAAIAVPVDLPASVSTNALSASPALPGAAPPPAPPRATSHVHTGKPSAPSAPPPVTAAPVQTAPIPTATVAPTPAPKPTSVVRDPGF